MARIRTIKPEFWTDETVVELDFGDRLLFIGLWNFADDQGYLPYRPKRIKMQVFPGDDFDMPAGLKRLWESSVLSLYTSNQGPLLHIRNWSKHQKISNPSTEKYLGADLQRCDSWEEWVQSPLDSYPAEGKGREGKGRESTSEVADATTDKPDPRADVERICTHLAERLKANGVKNVAIGAKWRDAARLMLDKDEYTEAQVIWLIDAATADEFWRANILSMPKLRSHADQLRLKFAPRAVEVRTAPDGSVDESSLPPVEESWMRRRPK